MRLRYSLSKGTQRKTRVATLADTLTSTQIIDLLNAKNPGWSCRGWRVLKPKTPSTSK